MNIFFKLLNSLFLEIQKNHTRAFLCIAMLSWIVSTYAFSLDGFKMWNLVSGLTLSFADMPDGNDGWILTGKLLWMLTLASAITFVALKDFLYKQTVKSIVSAHEKHIVICVDSLASKEKFGFELVLSMTHDYPDELQESDSLLSDISNLNQYVIVINNTNMTAESLSQYSAQGVYFINADVDSPDIWRKAGIDSCEYVIVSDESDSKNIEIANGINKYIDEHRFNKVSIYTDVEDYATMSVATKEKNISFFNSSLSTARKLFQKKSLTTGVDTIKDNDEQVHLLVLGFGNYGISVVLEAIKLGHFYNGNSLKITIVDQSQSAFDAFKKYYNYQDIKDLELEFISMNVESDAFDQTVLRNFDATYVAMCLGNDNVTQLVLQDMIMKLNQSESSVKNHIPFSVRMKGAADLRCIHPNMDIFKFETIKIEDIKGRVLNDKARELHEKWGGEQWEMLSFHEKDKNFAPADHEIIKMEVIKQLIQEYGQKSIESAVSLTRQEGKHYQFKDLSDLQQKMIDTEHRRWNAYHFINGWVRKDIDDKDAEHKQHPCLVETPNLENLPKAKDFKIDYYVEDINSWKIAFDRIISVDNN